VATEAWRQASEVWKSRIILVKCWTGCRGDHDYKKTPLSVTVACVYTPTAAAAPSGVHSKFRCDLQDTIDAVPYDEK